MINRSSIFTESFGALLVRGVGIVLMFGSTTIAARVLGPDVYGTFASALSLAVLLAALAPAGTDRILANRLSVSSSRQDAADEIAVTLHASILMAGLVLAVMLGILAAGAATQFNSEWLSMLGNATLLFIPLAMLYLRQWIAIPLVGARRAMLTDQIVIPLLFSAMLIFVLSGIREPSAAHAAGLYAVSIVSALGFSLRTGSLQELYFASLKSLAHSSLRSVRGRLREGLPFVAVSTGGVVSQTCMPLVVALTCGFHDSAYFALAAPFAALPLIPLGVFNLSLIPTFSRHYQAGNVVNAEHAIRTAATVTFYSSAAIGLCIWLCSPLLSVILGKEYYAVAGLLPALLLASMVDCLTGPTVPVMQSMGMERFYSRALLVFIVFQLLLVWAGGQAGGVEGAAIALLIARCLWNIAVGWKIYQVHGLRMLPFLNLLTVSPSFTSRTSIDRPVVPETRSFSVTGSATGISRVGPETRAA